MASFKERLILARQKHMERFDIPDHNYYEALNKLQKNCSDVILNKSISLKRKVFVENDGNNNNSNCRCSKCNTIKNSKAK